MLHFTLSPGWLGEIDRAIKQFVFFILLATPVYLSAETDRPVLTTDQELATAGYYQLSWKPGISGASYKSIHFELQQSAVASFTSSRTIYRGPDRASVISGQGDGDYFYRVRSIFPNKSNGNWSRPVLVKVKHHSLQKAWLFFYAGAVVFIFILIFIISSASRKD